MAQKTEAGQSQAVLAEIRDTLLETYASNDGMNQVILSSLEPRAWRLSRLVRKATGGPLRRSSRICTTAGLFG